MGSLKKIYTLPSVSPHPSEHSILFSLRTSGSLTRPSEKWQLWGSWVQTWRYLHQWHRYGLSTQDRHLNRKERRRKLKEEKCKKIWSTDATWHVLSWWCEREMLLISECSRCWIILHTLVILPVSEILYQIEKWKFSVFTSLQSFQLPRSKKDLGTLESHRFSLCVWV